MSAATRYAGVVPRLFGLEGLPGATQRGLAIAFSTSIAAVMGTQLVSPSLPAMMQPLRVDQAAIGLVVTAYTLPAVFLTPVAGALADLHGRRPLLFGGLLVFGLAGAAVALAPTFQVVLALRALLVVADVTAVFWVLGGLSLLSVALAAVVLPTWARRPRPLTA